MSAGDSGQPPPLKYMSVPEKIELTGHPGGSVMSYPLRPTQPTSTNSREQSGRYRPMKVPDMITLESSSAPPSEPFAGMEMQGGGRGGMRGDPGHAPSGVPLGSDDGMEGKGQVEQIRQLAPHQNVQRPNQMSQQPTDPVVSSNYLEAPNRLQDVERRVKSLEQRVQRLTETVVNSPHNAPTGNPSGGNGFWYVLTFAGWMMVPLIVAFMYQYKKSS